MAERVFLHVGAPKTGTTYLQQVLWDNRATLRRAGLLLPGTRKAHYQAMGDLRRGIWHDPGAWWTWERLAAKTRSWPGTVVISEEMLGAATPEQAERAVESLRPAEVHVVVTGRDLGRTIPSSWQQAVRARSVGTFGRYVAALRSGAYPEFWQHQTPLPILRRWGDALSPDHRHLVTLPPAGSEPGLLWQRFAGILGVPDGMCRLDGTARHVSLGAPETELLRRVNLALGDDYPLRDPYLRVVHGHLVAPVLVPRTHGERFGLPAEASAWVTSAGERMVDELAAYPCDVAGDLRELLPTDLRTSKAPDEIDDAALLDAAVETIVGMLHHSETLASTLRDAEPRSTRTSRRLAVGTRRRLGQAADRIRRLARLPG